MLASPDYSLGDILKLFRGMRFSFEGNLIHEMNSVAFDATIPSMPIPVFFFQGAHDAILPRHVLDAYYRALIAPRGDELVILPNSAHIYSVSDSRTVEHKMIAAKVALLP